MVAKLYALGRSAVLVGALAVGACSGADGEPGAAGKDGTNGTDGTDGIDGKDGQDGLPGDAGPPGDPGPQGDAGPVTPPRLLDAKIGGWVQANADAINAMITKYGIAGGSFDAKKRPVAVFDWDNTVIKNDIGDATFAWMVKHDVILQPPGKDWGATSPALTTAAKAALNAACDSAAAAGQPLPTSTNAACAAEIMNIYYNGKTAAGTSGDAWPAKGGTTTTNYPYAWVSQLQAGHTPSEVRSWALAAFDENVNAPVGTKQTVGGVEMAGYVRVYEQIRDLAETLDENGFDVWVLTASPQYVVEAISEEIGVPPHQVVGIRPVVSSGKITYGFQGCGTLADGQTSLITYYNGKRCWINKTIFGEPAASQLAPNPDLTKRPVFVAGDSDTDIAMLKDATALKLVLERNKIEVSCNAYANYQNKWLHQPMFIEPKSAPAAGAFDCPAAKDPDGNAIVDEAGQPFPKKLP